MGIKTAILKNKLEKTATSGELFVADQLQRLYDVMEQLVKATHNESADEIKALTKEMGNKLYDYCVSAKRDIEGQTKQSVDEVKKQGEKAAVNVDKVVARIEGNAKSQIDRMTADMTRFFDKVKSEIESKRGEPGLPGKPGAPGQNGSPDTPEEVVAKVNKKGGVKISAVDGLPEALKKAKKEGGGAKAGGGMGNVLHETKNVSSSTTSVSVAYPIAAGGRAAWIYYQGQFLVYGTHYTVNGKIISLTATPLVNGTFLDITYIRGS